MTSALPVTAVEGIGSRTARALEEIAVFSVADLVRASAEHMHRVVERTSLDTIRGWRAMALLMEVEGVDGQWAEALVEGGVPSVETLRKKSPDDIGTLFEDARARGLIPAAPEPGEIIRMLLDATEIHFTGRVNGTVRGPDGNAVEGAEVTCGTRRTRTDARGRFRLVRLPLGAPLRLRVVADGLVPLAVDDPRVTRNDDVVDVQTFRLDRAAGATGAAGAAGAGGAAGTAGAAGTGGAAAAAGAGGGGRSSEYEGDRLPPLTAHSMTTEARSEALREGDVFVVHRFYANGDAQLVSKFLDYEDGRFIALHWRASIDSFPTSPAPKSGWRLGGGELTPIKLTPSTLALLRAQRRRRRAFRDRARPETRLEWDARRDEMAAFVAEDLANRGR